jgi:glutamate-1-semialdehyde 2,1-aminomutase
VVQAAASAAARGLSFGAPTVDEVRMAEELTRVVPGLEMVRMVNSGTEATMSALRLARAATGRPLVVKFEGSYHGHHDSLLIRAGSGAATTGVPDSLGVPPQVAGLTVPLPYNDLEAVRHLLATRGAEIAAVIVEPVAGNMGTVLPVPGFLEGLREATRQVGALLVADEVMTGFRVAHAGAQALASFAPDLICLAKVIGAGLPVGAYGGRRDLMGMVAPLGGVYQAGTLSGNPVAMAAGLAQLEAVAAPGFYERLGETTAALADGLEERARRHRVDLAVARAGGMLTAFFASRPPVSFAEVQATDTARFRRFFHGMLERGIFWPPSPFETAFPSAAHDARALEATLAAADAVFAAL